MPTCSAVQTAKGREAEEHAPRSVALVGSTYPPIAGGVETYNRRVAQALAERGHTVTVATRYAAERPDGGMRGLLTRTAAPRVYEEDGVQVHVIGAQGARRALLWPTYRLQFHAPAVAARLTEWGVGPSLQAALERCEVVHYSGTGRELLGFAALRAARRREVPFVVTSHLHADSWGDGPIDFRLYAQADRYIALTQEEKRYVVRGGVEERRVAVVGHGVNVSGHGDSARMRQRLGIEGPLVLYLGRKAAYKGFGRTLAAAPRVWKAVPEAHFVLAGPDEDDETAMLRKKHREVLRDPRVHELGFVSDEERDDLYAACTVYCQPSQAEAYGLVYLEAWAYGTPVVALDIPTLRELIAGAGGGLVTPEQPEAVAEALVRLLGDEALCNRLGEAGRERAEQSTWQRVADRLSEIYREARADRKES